MTLSMTGFGNEVIMFENKKLSIEIKSLNSKGIDISIKLPAQYKEKELEIRNLITQKLFRGKIEFVFTVDSSAISDIATFNEDLAFAYYNKIKNICQKAGTELPNDIWNEIIKLPNVLLAEGETINDEEWSFTKKQIEKAINKCIEFRTTEGKILENDILKNNENILNLLGQIPEYEKERIELIKSRIEKNYSEISNLQTMDKGKFEEELFFYIEKMDINEEKVRLKKHCEFLIGTINNEELAGKKLGFICQEIGREINTLGSKAHHIEIQKIVVKMKDELEKMKEQLFNVL